MWLEFTLKRSEKGVHMWLTSRNTAIASCVLAIAGLLVPGVFAQDSDLNSFRKPGKADSHPSAKFRARIAIYLVPPIDSRELDQYVQYLNLSDAQRIAIKDLFRQYRQDDEALREQELPALREQSMRLAEGGPVARQGLAAAEAREDLFAARNRFMDRLATLENEFFASWQPILSEAQAEQLYFVQLRRARVRNSVPRAQYPASGIDLVQLIYEEQASNGPLLQRDAEEFETALQAYDVELTPLCEKRAKAWLDAKNKSTLAFAQVPVHLEPTDPKRRAAVKDALAARKRAYSKAVRIEQRIVGLNERYLDLFCHALKPADAERLRQRYQRTAYPRVYPIDEDMAPILVAALELPTLTSDQKEDLTDVLNAYRLERDRYARRMVMAVNEMEGEFARTNAGLPGSRSEMRKKLTENRENRREAARQALMQMRAILNEAQFGTVKSQQNIPDIPEPRQPGQPTNILDARENVSQ